ncbi:hypothetical protein [Caulobacter segnis]|uniref:Uncharacterized protein n=1 Tax=Caulobacter segnis TaxID=88688 RepID=A0A2W5UZ32_9CAUL|nr:hypothetical protein [Caulobacter segnis]PZR32242.1 MAG: hypothetical protein DI526_17185 [Caulobacter segnis]
MSALKMKAAIAAVALMVAAPTVSLAANTPPPPPAEVSSLLSRMVAALVKVAGQSLKGEDLIKAYKAALTSEIVDSGAQPSTVLAALDAVPASGNEQRLALNAIKARILNAETLNSLRPTAFTGVWAGLPGDSSSSSGAGGGGSDYRRP